MQLCSLQEKKSKCAAATQVLLKFHCGEILGFLHNLWSEATGVQNEFFRSSFKSKKCFWEKLNNLPSAIQQCTSTVQGISFLGNLSKNHPRWFVKFWEINITTCYGNFSSVWVSIIVICNSSRMSKINTYQNSDF